jgi:hypothetical protein
MDGGLLPNPPYPSWIHQLFVPGTGFGFSISSTGPPAQISHCEEALGDRIPTTQQDVVRASSAHGGLVVVITHRKVVGQFLEIRCITLLEDCDVSQATPKNPSGCLADLCTWTEVTVGSNVNGAPQPANFSTDYAPGKVTTNEGATCCHIW